jgi:hypothetical protein
MRQIFKSLTVRISKLATVQATQCTTPVTDQSLPHPSLLKTDPDLIRMMDGGGALLPAYVKREHMEFGMPFWLPFWTLLEPT